MNWKTWLPSAVATALIACGGGGGGDSSGGGATLTLTATPGALVANGVNASIIHVAGSQKGPIVVRTDRGTFLETGTNTASSPTTPFDVTLVTCNSQVILIGCAGNAQVSASDQNLASARIQVRFVGVELCANGADDDGDLLVDCADPDCATQVCGANGLACSPSSPSTCSCPSGQTNETDAQCRSATPADNDCDGKAGCNDTDCTGKVCPTTTQVGGRTVFGTCKLSGGVGTCTCVSTAEGTGTTCSDGLDNDCDGFIDCDDPSCQGAGGLPGKSCDATRPGLTCSNPAATGNVSTCTVCAPGGSFVAAQPTETTCNDSIDNDCDGQTDCGDSDCVSRAAVCGTKGERCTAALQCRCPDLSGTESACDDGIDNDCDGFKDCADSNCAGTVCGPNGFRCGTTGTSCTCTGNGGAAQPAKETSCADVHDNDCDGLVDCADPDCRPATAGTFGQACATASLVANARCDYFGACACPGGQSREATCGDGVDNDCDGLVDCADPDCSGQSCGTFGKTCPAGGGACSCPSGLTETCSDGLDNNCDGKTDCDDAACAGQGCLAGFPSYQCRPSGAVFACKDTSQYILTVTAGTTKVPADGLATTPVTAYLQDNTLAAPGSVGGATISFSTAPVGAGTVAPTSGVTDSTGGTRGKTTVTFTAPLTAVASVVTASYLYGNGLSVVGTVTITAPLLSQIGLSSQQYTVLGARDSGYQESSELTFALLDSNNLPYPAGLTVNFEHASLGGSFIGPTPNCPAGACVATGVTDATGKVKVILHSGRTAGVVSVVAKAQAGGSGLKTFTAGNIAIVAAKASGSQITLNCSPRNIPALILQDCTNSNYAGSDASPRCTVTLADRYGQALGVATVTTFESEAGIVVGSPASTPPFPTPPQGEASAFVKVTGGKLPVDVTPWTGGAEYSLVHSWDGCPQRTHNPRDGLVTVIVKVRGEEGFVDGSNGCPRDGVYQGPSSGVAGCAAGGENFIDLGEPFVDSNDNGTWNAGEAYEDSNNNGRWDGPNGAWDADTTIWAQARIVYTDYVVAAWDGRGELASRFFNGPASPPAPTPFAFFSVLAAVPAQPGPPPIPAQAATSFGVNLFFTDLNFNLPNSKYTYAVSKPATAKLTAAFTTGGAPTTIDALGMNFTQLYCNSLTPANPSVDCSNQCLWAPCYPIVDVSQFAYGAGGSILITGGATPDAPPVCVDVTGSLTTSGATGTTTVTTPIQVCGRSD